MLWAAPRVGTKPERKKVILGGIKLVSLSEILSATTWNCWQQCRRRHSVNLLFNAQYDQITCCRVFKIYILWIIKSIRNFKRWINDKFRNWFIFRLRFVMRLCLCLALTLVCSFCAFFHRRLLIAVCAVLLIAVCAVQPPATVGPKWMVPPPGSGSR